MPLFPEAMPLLPEEMPLYANELTPEEPSNEENSEPEQSDRTIYYQGNEFMFIEEWTKLIGDINDITSL